MTLISVITAVAVGTPADHLAAAYASLTGQDLPVGHQWEWIVQLDGDGVLELPEPTARDDRVLVGRGPHGGPAMARSLALTRSSGAIVVNLDADDQLTHGALGRIVDALIDPDTGWTTSAVIDLLPDGSRRRFDADPPGGRLHQGAVTKHWTTHDWALLVHPSTLAARREIVIAIGGWLGVPVSEDMGLLVGLDQLAHGTFIAEPGVLRRIHDQQMTRRPDHQQLVAGLRGLIWDRAIALEAVFGSRAAHRVEMPPQVAEQRTATATPAAAAQAESWMVRAVAAVALVHLGAFIGVASATPSRWLDVLAIATVSVIFYAAVGGLIRVRNRRGQRAGERAGAPVQRS
ncbi:glycosyltransferase family 2 protein [Nocardia asteroides]|uniref:glycosyltransferase family 2 protein n=1 Tax=Nocardia asteroides TaxID=1824 RepID=UPI001E600BD4|nr:glycosyltransferase [Nocardia asteroides]UGT58862.1 glycosyltransferase [Nocardia asteroides]